MKRCLPRKFLLLFLIVSTITGLVYSQTSILTKGLENKILTGLEATFNFEFAKSEKIFNQIIKNYPGNPSGYHFKSIPYLWRFLDNRNDSEFVQFFKLSDSTLKKGNDLLLSNLDDPYLYFILGSAYSYRAMAFTRKENYLDAVLATKRAFAALNNALITDNTFYDAYMGLGIFNFMIAQTPPALKWAMYITGITGDKQKGLDYLTLAAKKGKFTLIESKFYLSQILGILSKRYWQNLLFKYSLANYYLKLSKLDEAENIVKRIITIKNTQFKQLVRYSNLLMADIYFYRNKFNIAKNYYEIFLKDSSEDHYRGIAALREGLCCSFLNDTLTAEKYFSKTDEGNIDIDDDRYAESMGKKFLEDLPDSVQLEIVFIKNLINSGKYKAARDSLLILKKDKISKSLLAEINLHLSNVLFYLKDFTQSYSYALSAMENDEGEKWIYPFANYYAARASAELNYIPDAMGYIQKARKYSDYYYENKLGNMLGALEFNLQKAENIKSKN